MPVPFLHSLNFTNLTTICGISRRTLERYLFILESTFIIRLINPFYSNKIKEVTKMPKLYFMDTGIRNIIVGDLNSLEGRRDSGSLVENSVFLMLLTGKGPLDEIYYWRTKAGAELIFLPVFFLSKGNIFCHCKPWFIRTRQSHSKTKNDQRKNSTRHAMLLLNANDYSLFANH